VTSIALRHRQTDWVQDDPRRPIRVIKSSVQRRLRYSCVSTSSEIRCACQ
jgi:hypothetical protein